MEGYNYCKNVLFFLIIPSSTPYRLSPLTSFSLLQIDFFFLFSFFFFFLPHHAACKILVPQPGIEPVPPEIVVRSFNHWMASEVPRINILFSELRITFFHLYLNTLNYFQKILFLNKNRITITHKIYTNKNIL